MLHINRTSAGCVALVALALLIVTHPAIAQHPTLGGNLNGVIDWNRDTPFVNLAKQSRGAYSLSRKGSNGNPLPATVGADGQPTENFWLRVWDEGVPIPAGIYVITYQGPSSSLIDKGVSTGVLIDKGFANGIRTYHFIATAGASNILEFNFRNTQGLVKNVQVLLPGYSTSAPPLFTKPYLAFLKSLSPDAFRFMDWRATNGNMEMNWSERSLPTDPTFNTYSSRSVVTEGAANGLGQTVTIDYAKGIPWEIIVQLANTTGKDIWINVPILATDDYVTQLATLLKNGSTVNGITYPGLKAGRHIYVEYSNEVWNDGFSQTHVNRQAAVNEVITLSKNGTVLNGSDLNYDNIPLTTHTDWQGNTVYDGSVTWGDRLVARRIMQISTLFSKVWGAPAINTTIRPVLPYQLATYRFDTMLNYLNTAYGPPSKYLYGIAVAPYFNAGNGIGLDARTDLTADDVIGALETSIDDYKYTNTLQGIAYHAAFNNLKLLAYEGGPDTFGPNNIVAKKTATLDPVMQQLVQDYLNIWYTTGGILFNWFTVGAGSFDTQFGTWALTDDITNLTEPKVLGYQAAHAETLPAVTAGTPVPGYIDTRATADTDPPYRISFLQKFIGAGFQFHYLLNAPKSGTYRISVLVGNGNGKAEPLRITLNNGTPVTINTPVTSSGSWAWTNAISVNLKAGLNGLRLLVPTQRPYELDLIRVTMSDSTGAGVSPSSSDFYSWFDQTQTGKTYTNLFNVTDPVTASDALTVTVVSDNPILLPASGISVAKGDFKDQWGGHYNRKLTIVPATNQTGTASFTVTLANGGGVKRTATAWGFTVPYTTADFQLGVPLSAIVHQGTSSSAYPISVWPGKGFTGTVTFSVANLPSGLTTTFSTNSSKTGTSITFTASLSTAPGPYTVNIVGKSGNISHSFPVRLVVHP